MKQKSISNPSWTKSQRWEWFKHTKYYKPSTLHKYWNTLKKEEQKEDKPLPPPPTTDRIKQAFATKVAKILFKYKYENKYEILYDILNKIGVMDGACTY